MVEFLSSLPGRHASKLAKDMAKPLGLRLAREDGQSRSSKEEFQNRSKAVARLILRELKLTGMVRGPFKNRFDYYFATRFEPKREQAEALIENLLRDAGAKLTTRSSAEKRGKGFLKTFFNDALAALKAEAQIVQLKGGRNTTFYVHREAVLEQLRPASAPELERLAYDTPSSKHFQRRVGSCRGRPHGQRQSERLPPPSPDPF
jgi:hypothetical protein